ncbi:MAG: DUF4391 domain-containing protein [Prevotellaceae bacterium]|jgi:hypothetical protein|nr:DUF4391 domain-containing protein [Prevotellaceae bacterium]
MLELPPNIIVNRFVPKEKIYAQANIPSKGRQMFVEQVEKIVWLAKISPTTMNIAADRSFPELDIFEIKLKGGELSQKVLETIDSIIPRPILFQISFNGQSKYAIAYKIKPERTPSTKRKVVHYYQTDLGSSATLQIKGSSVKTIYENYILQIDPEFSLTLEKGIEAAVAKTLEVKKLRQEVKKLTAQIANELQDNKRHKLAKKRHELAQKIKPLAI